MIKRKAKKAIRSIWPTARQMQCHLNRAMTRKNHRRTADYWYHREYQSVKKTHSVQITIYHWHWFIGSCSASMRWCVSCHVVHTCVQDTDVKELLAWDSCRLASIVSLLLSLSFTSGYFCPPRSCCEDEPTRWMDFWSVVGQACRRRRGAIKCRAGELASERAIPRGQKGFNRHGVL